MAKKEFDDDDKTIFTSIGSLDSDERDAVRSGQKRGERAAMAENPERFGMARQKAKNKGRYDAGYLKAFGHE